LSEEGTRPFAVQNDGTVDLWVVAETFVNLSRSYPMSLWRRRGEVGGEVYLGFE
jgi:hypothetical protein